MCVVREGVGDQGKGGIWEGMGKAEPSSWQLPRQGAEKCRRSFQRGRWIAVLRAGHRGDVPLFDTSPISECPKQLSITQQVKVSQWALLNLYQRRGPLLALGLAPVSQGCRWAWVMSC